MLSRAVLFLVIVGVITSGVGCGSGRSLVGIQIYPADPNLAHNTSYYIAPGATIQFVIQGTYSDRTAQTIPAKSGNWSSTNSGVASVDSSGLATSAGPLGVTTINASVGGHSSTVLLGVCDPTVVVCPPPPNP